MVRLSSFILMLLLTPSLSFALGDIFVCDEAMRGIANSQMIPGHVVEFAHDMNGIPRFVRATVRERSDTGGIYEINGQRLYIPTENIDLATVGSHTKLIGHTVEFFASTDHKKWFLIIAAVIKVTPNGLSLRNKRGRFKVEYAYIAPGSYKDFTFLEETPASEGAYLQFIARGEKGEAQKINGKLMKATYTGLEILSAKVPRRIYKFDDIVLDSIKVIQ